MNESFDILMCIFWIAFTYIFTYYRENHSLKNIVTVYSRENVNSSNDGLPNVVLPTM